jgi:hypothetical protein
MYPQAGASEVFSEHFHEDRCMSIVSAKSSFFTLRFSSSGTFSVRGVGDRAITLRTGSAERVANMDVFAKRALELLVEVIPAA